MTINTTDVAINNYLLLDYIQQEVLIYEHTEEDQNEDIIKESHQDSLPSLAFYQSV